MTVFPGERGRAAQIVDDEACWLAWISLSSRVVTFPLPICCALLQK